MNKHTAILAPLLFLLFAAGFTAFWVLVIKTIAVFGGWDRLAQEFGADAEPTGQRFNFQSMALNRRANYGSMLTIVVSDRGIYIRPWTIFAICHRPLMIPWERVATVSPRSFLWMKAVEFEISTTPTTVVRFGNSVYNAARPYLQRKIPIAT